MISPVESICMAAEPYEDVGSMGDVRTIVSSPVAREHNTMPSTQRESCLHENTPRKAPPSYVILDLDHLFVNESPCNCYNR